MSLTEFYQNYICLNLNQYENLKFNLEINKFLIVALVGVIFAYIVVNYKRSSLYLTLSKLVRHEAFGEENAKTLGELGINNGRIQRLMRDSSQIKAYVRRVGEIKYTYTEYVELMRKQKKEKGTNPDNIDFETAKFFIEKENAVKARELGLRNNSLVLNTVLFCIFTVIIFTCIIFLMPEILNLFNNLFAPS